MTVKTDVTNPPVSTGSGDKTNVNGSVDTGSEIEKKIRENLRVEYARESDALKERLTTYEDRIAELEEKDRLSTQDRELLERLKDKRDTLEDEVRILETDPKYRAYNEKMKRESNRAKDEAIAEAKHGIYVELMESQIEDWAESEKIEAKDLRKELNQILAGGRYGDKNPLQRAKLAMRDRLKMKALSDKEAELKKKELELNGSEAGDGIVREKSLDELKEKRDTIGLAKKLGL